MERTDTPEDRYLRDPLFRIFVDTIRKMLERCEMSPTEIREGAMLACIHYEMSHPPRPMFYRVGEASDGEE